MKRGSSCTSILVGSGVSLDGSRYIARNEDCGNAFAPVVMEVQTSEAQTAKTYKMFNQTEVLLPEGRRRRYTALPEADVKETGRYASAGFNEDGVAISATESLYGSCRALAFDPLVSSGIAEDAIPDLLLPFVASAREAVELMGSYVRDYGSAEANGILFADEKEAWYMEIPTGHHWIAWRLAEDYLAVAPNQVMGETFSPSSETVILSPGLMDFIEQYHLNPDLEGLNFRHIFGTQDASDRVYNTARAWDAMRQLAPKKLAAEAYAPHSNDFPLFYQPERKIGVYDIADVLGAHFEESPYDPLGREGTARERHLYRPIGVAKTQESHILQITPQLPHGLQEVLWLSLGATAFAPHVPFFANVDEAPTPYRTVSTEADLKEAYWLYRSLAYLAENLRFEESHRLSNYQREMRIYCLARVEQVRAEALEKKLSGAELRTYLAAANEETARESMALSSKLVTALLKTAFNRSELCFKMNPDL